MLIKSSELNQRLIFEKPSTTVNDLNEPTNGWTEDFGAWAKVRPVAARDLVAADHPYGAATYNFTVRCCCNTAGVTATSGLRIDWGGTKYYPVGEPLRIDGLRGFLVIRATSVKVNDV
jgi:SPP1 family predicted phage head-tail adaptor